MDVKEMGQRIKKCRKDMKLTQEELATRIGISPHYLYEIERGSKVVSVVILAQIIEQLHTTADYLMFGIENDIQADFRVKNSLTDLLIEVPKSQQDRLVKMVEAMLPFVSNK